MEQTVPPSFFHRHANDWLAQTFDCRAAEIGGIIRRQARDVEREVGRDAFVAEVKRRGFRLIRTRSYYIVVCESGPIDLVF